MGPWYINGASDTSWTWKTAQNSYAGKYIIRLYEVYVVEYVMTDLLGNKPMNSQLRYAHF